MVLGGPEEVHCHGPGAGRERPADRIRYVAQQAFSLMRGLKDGCDYQEGGKKREDGGVCSPFGQKELSVLECPPEGQAHPSEMHERIRVPKAGDEIIAPAMNSSSISVQF